MSRLGLQHLNASSVFCVVHSASKREDLKLLPSLQMVGGGNCLGDVLSHNDNIMPLIVQIKVHHASDCF